MFVATALRFDEATDVDLVARTAVIEVPASSTVTCTFTNTDLRSWVVFEKELTAGNPDNWRSRSACELLGNFDACGVPVTPGGPSMQCQVFVGSTRSSG